MLGNGRVSVWDQACPAQRYAKPFQRQETALEKVPVLAPQHPRDRQGWGSSTAKRQAGAGFCLRQSSGEVWLKSAEIMETLRQDTSLHAARKQTVQPKCAGTKPRPGNARSTGKDFHSYNHKYYFFLSFKPQHAPSESQTTPAICCPPHKASGMSPSVVEGKATLLPLQLLQGWPSQCSQQTKNECPFWALLEPKYPEHQGTLVSLSGVSLAPLTWPRG